MKAFPYLNDINQYQHWKTDKLTDYPKTIQALSVSIADLAHISPEEHTQVCAKLKKANMAIYQLPPHPISEQDLGQFGEQFGLYRLDQNPYSSEKAITSLTVSNQPGNQQNFIPYTNQPISWHTDGYYNSLDKTVNGVILHCVTSAETGGDNTLLDHEIAYIWLRDHNPEFITALAQADVMTIPAHIEDGLEKRPDQTGPVFSLRNGKLHMRYTQRKRSIVWKNQTLVQEALSCLNELLNSDSEYLIRGRLAAGQGLLCNNVLHNRTGFIDNKSTQQTRLILRARYYDRVNCD